MAEKDMKEKLVELLADSVYENVELDDGYVGYEVKNEQIADYLIANGVTVQEWISVKDRLPEENEYVLIWCIGEIQVARIEKGISEEERAKMKRGELPDPEIRRGRKRSSCYFGCDVQGNNEVPYRWEANGGPMDWFGQDVTHWMPLPQPPKGE